MSNKQTEIMQAAIHLFQQKGYHATSMQDLADAVGLQKGSLYHYISGKEDLLVVIVHDALSQYTTRLEEIRRLDLSVRQRLELAVKAHLGGIAENLGMLTIFLRESYALNPEQQQVINQETDRYNRMFEELLTEGIQAGEVRALNARLATRTMLGACNWFYRWYQPDGPLSIDQMANFFIDLLFYGIAAGFPASDQRLPTLTEGEIAHDDRRNV